MDFEDKFLKKVRAIYKPDDISNVRPKTYGDIGKTFTFQYSWIMDNDEMYPGIWALISRDQSFSGFGLWIPEFDLEILD